MPAGTTTRVATSPSETPPIRRSGSGKPAFEWQINKALELVTAYTITDRTNTRAISTADTLSYQQFEGGILRFQLQFNY